MTTCSLERALDFAIRRALKSPTVNAPVDNLSFMLPDSTPKSGFYTLDTAELFSALEGETSTDKRALRFLITSLDLHREVKLQNLHNAGNDANVSSMPLFLRLC